jgi:hypothetical protein
MTGRTFLLTVSFTSGATTIAQGDEVRVATWDNALDTVSCTLVKTPAITLAIPKRLLLPKRTPVAGIHPYSANVDGQAAAVEKAEIAVADWLAKEDEYKKAGTIAIWTKERDRRLDLLAKKRKTLNRKLIQEAMFNRFDAVIKSEVDAANTAAGLSGADALDPNLLKSMLFQESQLGTAGVHLEDPPSIEEKSRFNLGQVIDSSGIALLTMLEREQPAIVTSYNLGSLRTDLAAAQTRRKELQKKASRTPAENTELSELDRKAKQSWEIYIWEYRILGSAVGFQEAVRHFYSTSAPPKHLNYDFWAHMAVLWLFEKKKPGMTWKDAIRAYNGGGARATNYRNEVVQRAADAAAAAKAGKDFVPQGI